MTEPRPVATFLRLWLIVAAPYALLRLAFNLAVLRLVDLRAEFAYEILFVSLGQALVLWLVTRRRVTPPAVDQMRGSKPE